MIRLEEGSTAAAADPLKSGCWCRNLSLQDVEAMKQLEQLFPFVRFYQPPDQLSQVDVVRAHIITAPFWPIIDRPIGAADSPIEIGRAAPICRPIGHPISRPVRHRPDVRRSI